MPSSASGLTGFRVAALALAGAFFLGVIPYLILVVGPRADRRLHLDVLAPGLVSLAVGGLVLSVGMALAFWTVFVQVTQGQGTPLPIMPTQRLLTGGPYRYCRNPMVLGTVLAYLGVSIAAATVSGAAAVLLFGGLLVLYAKGVEEKELTERFGQDYVAYMRQVPFIIPFRRHREARSTKS